MEHKIIMLGGRRSGKSTILSSILNSLKKTKGNIFTIADGTDYSQQISTNYGMQELPSLRNKHNEVVAYMNKSHNDKFLVDMSPTYGKASYILEVTSKSKTLKMEFVDVPGEWMKEDKPDYKELVEQVKQSDVFIVAIDTPYMMNVTDEMSEIVNDTYNRITEITQVLSKMIINHPLDLKQIILCPVKCEKWVRDNKADEVTKKVKESYRNLINRWVDEPSVSIQIMPIQTAGGLEFSQMLPALLFFKDENDQTGQQCSRNPLTGDIIDKNGVILQESEILRLEKDTANIIDHAEIPRSWYKVNGFGFSPLFCEQPGYHVLKFIVGKEENVVKAEADAQRKKLDSMNPIWKFITIIFNRTFGKYLPVWKDVIMQLENSHCIKKDGDGFCYVNSHVE